MTTNHTMTTDGITIHALGGPTAILEIGGLRLLTDPTFDTPREYVMGPGRVLAKTAPTALQPADLGHLDAVLLSHDQHVDNLDTGGREFLARNRLLTLTTAAAAERLGGTARALPLWEEIELARPDGRTLHVTRVPALHGPEGSEPLVGEVAGFVLAGDGVPSVYVSGDNASLDLVAEIAGRFPVDVAILFAGAARTALLGAAYLTLTSAQAAQATRILNARHAVPLHFDSWRHFTEGADDLDKAFSEAGLQDRLTLLHPGSSAALSIRGDE